MDDVQMHLQAFGLHIVSELPMLELLPVDARYSSPQVEVRMTDLTEEWQQYSKSDCYYAIHEQKLYLHVPQVATYCVEGGRTIRVSPLPEAPAARVRMYVLGTCMGVLLMQRGMLPLHGSAVLLNGQAYAFVGESGAGKSTLAAAFVRAGFSLLSDDVIALQLSASQAAPIVLPAYPQQKLSETSLQQLGMPVTDSYIPLYREKYAVSAAESFHYSPVPLGGVFELSVTDEETVSLQPVHGLKQLPLLQQHTYRSELISLWGGLQWHWEACVAVGQSTSVYKLRRPAEGFQANELVRQVLEVARLSQHQMSSASAR